MQKYNLYEFDGYQLIERLSKNENKTIDFTTRTKKSLSGVIKSLDTHSDNAMFYQIKKYFEEKKSSRITNWGDDSLKDILIYIDFSKVFPFEKYAKRKFQWTNNTEQEQIIDDIALCESITKDFFEKGFDIQYEKEKVHYVPFEKSASMAREAAMIFIDQRLYQAIEQRIRLGFNFFGTDLSASKFYAYSGLYLSDAKRINETSDFILNEETVIVLADNVINKGKKAIPIEVISGDKNGIKKMDGFDKWPVKRYASGEFLTSVNVFDGEGIISPKYCNAINHILHEEYGMFGTATSFQIRMPFAKGMLHHVDFHQFICEKLHLDSCKDLWIFDAYGQKRNLEKAQIILTQSMFKIDKWLNTKEISSIEKEKNEDPMPLYFDRFHQYDHAFYVGITDMNASYSGKTKLNYQFLNTLALTDEELDEMVEEQDDLIKNGDLKDLLHYDIFDGGEDVSFDQYVEEGETWSTVASNNPAFLKDLKVKGMIKGVRYSLLKDIGRGRLTVKGSTKFLSRDLLALLMFMMGKIDTGEVVSKEQIEKARSEIRKELLWTTSFFVAECVPNNPVFLNARKKLRLKSNTYYGLLRNPHLSRNEQCSLKPFIPRKNGLYSRYFGHLKGIVMVPLNSFVPQALGGADFDGDIVKLITDERVNRAINDACYYPDSKETKEKHVRKLPIVMIPDIQPRIIRLPEQGVDFQTLKDTFSSRVGELSNRAFHLGKRQYDKRTPDSIDNLDCETGTILVGLEIDAAKTGRHPYLDDYIPKDRDRDYFIVRKEKIDKLPEAYKLEIKEFPETQNTKGKTFPHRLTAVTKYGADNGAELMTSAFVEEYSSDDMYYQIDLLPQRFLEKLCKNSSEKKGTADGSSEIHLTDENPAKDISFTFEQNADWKKQVSDPTKTKLVEELIYSYRRILETARNVYRIEERLKQSNYVGCINTILKIQHKGLIDDTQLRDLQENVFSQLLSYFDSYHTAEEALETIVKDRRWQFFETDQEKNDYVEKILFKDSGMKLSEEVQQALNHFRWNGYFLLYYYIKDIMLYYYETETERRIIQGEDKGKFSDHPAKFYEEFREIYEQSVAEKESKKIWNKKIIERCRSILREEFSDQVDIALMYVHKLRSRCDSYGTFFWDVFNADEILQQSGGTTHVK